MRGAGGKEKEEVERARERRKVVRVKGEFRDDVTTGGCGQS